MNPLRRPRLALPIGLSLIVPAALTGQVRASERATTVQLVNGTRIEVDYARPQARGRDPLFGGVVHWGEVWTPGANFATTLTVDRAVKLDGHDLEAGSYSLWLIPQEDEWTMVVSAEPRLFHTVHPPEDTWVAEYALTPSEGAHTEVLTFDFPVVKPNHAVLRLRWGTTTIPFRIDVPGWEPYALDREDRPVYFGTFDMIDEKGDPIRLGFWEGDGLIQGVLYDREESVTDVEEPSEVRGWRFQLVPLGLHRFLMGHYRDGELVNTEDGFLLYTLDAGGAATGLEWRTEESVQPEGHQLEAPPSNF